MATEITFLPAILAEVAAHSEERFDSAIRNVALRVEAEMKARVREGGAHQYGTKTPATPGGGPAVISGQLARSITHQRVPGGYRIGPADIPHTGYSTRRRVISAGPRGGKRKGGFGSKGNATAGQIGEWLENGGRYGVAYPFVEPAKNAVVGEIEAMIAAEFRAEL